MVDNILVATDGSSHAKKAVDFAGDFASKFGSSLHLIHVVQEARIPAEMKDFIEAEGLHESTDRAYLNTVGEQIIDEAKKNLTNHGVKEIKTSLLVGDAPEEILSFAKKLNFDMIILGNQGLSKVKEFLIGSVTSKVVRAAHCTCITVK